MDTQEHQGIQDILVTLGSQAEPGPAVTQAIQEPPVTPEPQELGPAVIQVILGSQAEPEPVATLDTQELADTQEHLAQVQVVLQVLLAHLIRGKEYGLKEFTL